VCAAHEVTTSISTTNLTAWSRDLHDKLTVANLVRK